MSSNTISKNKMKETLVDLVLSWSLRDVLNGQLLKGKVEKIPKTFLSIEHYLRSYRFPLIEETHADLNSSFLGIAQAPVCEILSVQRITKDKPPNDLCYNIVLKNRNMDGKHDKRMYEPGNGDLIVLSDVKPQSIADLSGTKKSYILALVTGGGNGDNPLRIDVRASKEIVIEQKRQNNSPTLFAVYLINMTTNIRIWEALNSDIHKGNMNIIKEELCTDSIVSLTNSFLLFYILVGANCDHCFTQDDNLHEKKLLADLHSFSLNGSQSKAVARSIMTRNYKHKSSVKLIWGPPGTGKTKTVSVLLWEFLRLKCRTLTCAPTNIAVMEVISRLLRLVRQHFRHHNFGLGDILLFGNGKRMKVDDHDDLLDVFLDYRIDRLKKCFSPHNGWKHWLNSMILLLEDPAQQYLLYLKSSERKEEEKGPAQIEKQDIKKWKGKEESVCVEERKGEDKPAQNLKEGKMEKDIVQTRINKVEEDGKVNMPCKEELGTYRIRVSYRFLEPTV
ncbi:PREDICTED: probable helicase MAGATAMA 3 [Nelumbo nucifera]|uniref:Probable helicase MAGATAMA 3 n=1 Tax=Nelumbo nucifera TaxID=4432 RepID=A0A1U8Q1H6_NELNU|nr:PREDICTED: probable helicase MAGATAMA 3 [Nelumbo nucifera]